MLTRERPLNSCGPPSLVEYFLLFSEGFQVAHEVIEAPETKDAYSPEDRAELLEYHRRIAEIHNVENPYFNFTRPENAQESPRYLLNQQVSCVTSKKYGAMTEHIVVGKLADFYPEVVAAIITRQTHAYMTSNTMGEFPINDPRKVQELIAAMIGGFSLSDVYVTFQHQINLGDDSYNLLMDPFAGAKLVRGSGSKTVAEANGSPEATIPTLAALRITDPQIIENFDTGFAETPESSLVCASRLYTAKTTVEARDALYPAYTSAYLALAAEHYGVIDNSQPRWLIYDTHLPGLITMLAKKFGGRLVADNGFVEPTDLVSRAKSILGDHYEAMRGEIRIGALEMTEFSRAAREFLESKRTEKYSLPIPASSLYKV